MYDQVRKVDELLQEDFENLRFSTLIAELVFLIFDVFPPTQSYFSFMQAAPGFCVSFEYVFFVFPV